MIGFRCLVTSDDLEAKLRFSTQQFNKPRRNPTPAPIRFGSRKERCDTNQSEKGYGYAYCTGAFALIAEANIQVKHRIGVFEVVRLAVFFNRNRIAYPDPVFKLANENANAGTIRA